MARQYKADVIVILRRNTAALNNKESPDTGREAIRAARVAGSSSPLLTGRKSWPSSRDIKTFDAILTWDSGQVRRLT